MDYTVAFRGRLHILYTVGWSDLKKCYTLCAVPNCCWSPIPKFHVFLMPLSLVAGPMKIWAITLKSAHKNCFNTFLKPTTGGNVFFDFLKAKNEEIFQKIFFWTLYRPKTVFPFFRK